MAISRLFVVKKPLDPRREPEVLAVSASPIWHESPFLATWPPPGDHSGYNRSYAPSETHLKCTSLKGLRPMIRPANGPRRTSISRFNSSDLGSCPGHNTPQISPDTSRQDPCQGHHKTSGHIDERACGNINR